MASDPLQHSAAVLKGVGAARLEQFRSVGIQTVADLLFYFPRAYEDLSDRRPIAGLTTGLLQTAEGEVVEILGRHLADGRSLVSIILADGKDCLEGVWFNQPYISSRFRYGQRIAFSGKPRRYRGHWQMTSPRVHVLVDGQSDTNPGVIPIYPLAGALRPEHLRSAILAALEKFAGDVAEVIPEALRHRHGLPHVSCALRDIHLPQTQEAAEAARGRFAYEEFLVLQAALAVRRRALRDRLRAPMLVVTPQMDARIRTRLPFRLTADQERAVADIRRDLASSRPMQRLLQADVGAGKTAIAVYALLAAVANKHQAALMAPTAVLAKQHWQTLESYLKGSRVRRLLLTSALTATERERALRHIREGQIDLVIGTQALLQEGVDFARLGLIIIDEQHKFGVHQRAHIRRLGTDPHYLLLSATPIPRTIALAQFGDLDRSTMRMHPPGRLPVKTRCVGSHQREKVYRYVVQGLQQRRQCFVICPVITGEEQVKGAVDICAELQTGFLKEWRVGLLHSALDEGTKSKTMQAFRAGRLDVLVCTVVVEVGIDVPNATLMVIENADRFGLSQLHQLRGRISRGRLAGECFLIGDPQTAEAQERLKIVARIADGFELAEHDLRLRGAGEFFGPRQHGPLGLRVADLIKDENLLKIARRDALELVSRDPRLERPEHKGLRSEMLRRYGKGLDLATIG